MSVFESGLFILAAAKSIKFMLYEGRQTPHLAIILLRDSMIYFGGVLALILANLITWSAGRLNMQNAADPVTRYGETTLRTLQPLKFKQSIRSMFSRGTSTLVDEMPEEHEMDVIDIRSRQERFDITTTALSPVPEEP
ncbi:hypothetical protein EW026_g7756 [Hermanssonia centrifuga]|uniref:Uncharacterized protein n=2 Tax=Hermanssonia centrifuga TaxID=98765 RepID=A0A4S4K8J1_9APHY|nr:hypothetical protein EW026_g7756 [Hermanssonia centrifuga]